MTRLPISIPAFAGLRALAVAPICATLLAIAPTSASAQSDSQNAYSGPYAGANWSTRTVLLESGGECTAIINHGALGLDAAGTNFSQERYGSGSVEDIAWSGSCDANGLITGSGLLVLAIDSADEFLLKGFEAAADRGVLNGNGTYYPDDDEYEPGIDIRFVSGCNNWNGKRPNSCDTSRAAQLRDQYLASRRPATKTASPPSDAAALNAQQNAAAAAWLKADTEAKRVQAQKVADFERKQAEFNRQQAEYLQQQEDYKAALAAQQAEVARITKANADAQACYKGDKSRCN
ncbi:MAG: hypothetical protein Q7T60_12930 [Sphingopyxis sp.]|nr:hypothetical protein [Sphingopyxis sp.]